MFPSDACAATFGASSLLASALHVGSDGGPDLASWKARALAYAYSPAHNYLTVPGAGAASRRGFRPSVWHPRRTLAALCAATCCHGNHHNALYLRMKLHDICSAAAHEVAASGHLLQCALGSWGRHFALGATAREYRASVLSVYGNSTYCLMPAGDWPSRAPAMVDAMSVGCIPVIFHAQQKLLWPAHVPSWDALAVFVDSAAVLNASVDVLALLDAIPPKLVRQRREKLRSVVPSLIYAMADGDDVDDASGDGQARDAFDTLLDYASQHAHRWKRQQRMA